MKSIDKLIINLAVVILIIGIFFSLSNKYINMTYCSVVGTILLLIYLIAFKKSSIKINKIFLLLFSITIIFMVSSFVFFSISGFKYSMYFLIGTIIYLTGSNVSEIKDYIIKYFKILSKLFAIATIFSAILGNRFNFIYRFLFDSQRYFEVVALADHNCFSGLAGQTGLNAFFISIGLLITYIDIFTTKEKRKNNIIILTIYLIALMLTAKRAILLYTIVLMLIIIFYKNRDNILKIIKYFFIVLFIGGIIFFFIYNIIPRAFYVIERFFNQKDISTGRFELYEEAWGIFKENKLYGIGINNFSNYLEQKNGTSIQAHNVVFQLLAEIGGIQTIYVLYIIIYIYIRSIKNVRSNLQTYIYYGIAIQTLFLMYFITGNALFDVPILYTYIIALILSKNKRGEK